LRQLKAHNVSLTAQRNLYLVHEELKNKDLESDEKIISRILAGRNRGIHPLNHVVRTLFIYSKAKRTAQA